MITVKRMGYALLSLSAFGMFIAACTDVGTAPDVPAAIEMAPFPSPSVVVGDTLRNLAGALAPVRAIVRNTAGDTIANAPVRYLYADFNRDSALLVDSLTGRIIARKAITGEARIAARIGSSLQVIKNLIVTVRPDTVEGTRVGSLLTTTFPDTGRSAASSNSTQPFAVTVRNKQGTAPTGVNGWVVRFQLVKPANPANDTASAVYLVDDRGTASILDTTDAGGNAGRKARVRASRFPVTGTDTLEVDATVTYRGQTVRGAPIRLKIPVKRGAGGP